MIKSFCLRVYLYKFVCMRLKIEKPAKGKLLVAEPFLGDPSFERSVVILNRA